MCLHDGSCSSLKPLSLPWKLSLSSWLDKSQASFFCLSSKDGGLLDCGPVSSSHVHPWLWAQGLHMVSGKEMLAQDHRTSIKLSVRPPPSK